MARAAKYIASVIDVRQRNIILQEATAVLKARRAEFDAIAVRGVSGLLVGPTLATRLRKALIVVRKNIEHCHSSQKIEAGITEGRYIVLDDFVATGRTVETVVDTIALTYPLLRPVAAYFYRAESEGESHACGLPWWNREAAQDWSDGASTLRGYVNWESTAAKAA